jgi:hypothetical protein
MPPAKAEGDALTDCSGTGEELYLLNQCKPADMPVKSGFDQVRRTGQIELGENPVSRQSETNRRVISGELTKKGDYQTSA